MMGPIKIQVQVKRAASMNFQGPSSQLVALFACPYWLVSSFCKECEEQGAHRGSMVRRPLPLLRTAMPATPHLPTQPPPCKRPL